MGDLNSELEDQDIKSFMTDYGLVLVLHELHGKAHYGTYIRGQREDEKFITLPVHFGYEIKQWKTLILHVSQKKVGCIDVDRLRYIQLKEADENCAHKQIWGVQLQKYAEECKAINGMQHGSRANQWTHTASLSRTLT